MTRSGSRANTGIRASETTTLDGQEAPNFVSGTRDFGNVDPIEAPC